MAATIGFGKRSTRSNTACPSRASFSASAASVTVCISSIFAPATKPSGFPLARTSAFTASSFSSRSRSWTNSSISSG